MGGQEVAQAREVCGDHGEEKNGMQFTANLPLKPIDRWVCGGRFRVCRIYFCGPGLYIVYIFRLKITYRRIFVVWDDMWYL
jgi:hypothetical protein